jgi:transcriptional regulator with XRE-family HTH domain
MQVRDRKKIARLMVIQDATQVDVAGAAGWNSHSIVGRILRGEVTTVTPERAIRIANFFQVPVDDLFVTRVSTQTSHPVASKGRVA